MGKVLRANPASGSATLQRFLYPSPPVTDAWVTFDVLFPPETVEWFNLHGDNIILLLMDNSSNNASVVATGVPGGLGVGGDPGATWAGMGGSSDAPLPDSAWHTVEYHYHQSVVAEMYIDSVLRWSGTPSGSHNLNEFAIGPWTTFGADAPFYFDNIKIGTTRGGSDIISDDFESGSLSPSWSAHGGDLTIVDDPVPYTPSRTTMHYKGPWDSATAYVVGDTVHYEADSEFCICVADNTNVNPVANAGGPGRLGTYWFVEY